jgi:hypothetical protein
MERKLQSGSMKKRFFDERQKSEFSPSANRNGGKERPVDR